MIFHLYFVLWCIVFQLIPTEYCKSFIKYFENSYQSKMTIEIVEQNNKIA